MQNDLNGAGAKPKDTFWKKISRMFFEQEGEQAATPSEQPALPETLPIAVPEEKLADLYNVIEDEHRLMEAVMHGRELDQLFMHSAKSMVKAGYLDGIYGIESGSKDELAANKAERIYDRATILFSGQLAFLRTSIDARKANKAKATEEYEVQNRHYKTLAYYASFFPSAYSRKLAFFYGFVFCMLMIAEFPLSIQLFQAGFRLGDADYPIKTIFTGNHFWKTIGANWEALLMAMGVTVSSVYIKIFYDHLSGSQYGQKLLSQKGFAILCNGNKENTDMSLTEEEQAYVKKEERKQSWVRGVIVAFTLITITVLAFFRSSAWQVTENPADQLVGNSTLFAVFLCLTILFPVVGGVCLSLSLNAFQNIKALQKAAADKENSHALFLTASQELTEEEKKSESIGEMIEKWQDSNGRIEKLKRAFLSYYQQAYQLGICQPDAYTKHMDFFEKVSFWRQKAIARKINTHIITSTPKA